MPTVARITEGCTLGEAPHWDVASQSLFFVDIEQKKIFKYTPSTNTVAAAKTEKKTTFIIPVDGKKNEFVISQENELVIISWDGKSDNVTIIKKIGAVDASSKTPKTFNDGKCDPAGRLWAGAHIIDPDFSKTQPLGVLYSLDSNLHLKPQLDQIRCSNGLAFNAKAKKMFYIDSFEGVYRLDFDIESGTISNKELWFSFKKNNVPGFPDGMTIDSDGNLWVAAVMGARILKVSGSQKDTLISFVNIPGDQVTCMTFAGENLDELYVTTGSLEFEGKKYPPPDNGALYKVTQTGSKGLPAANFKLN